MKNVVLYCFLLLAVGLVNAQSKDNVVLVLSEGQLLPPKVSFKKNVVNEEELRIEMKKLLSKLQNAGFIESSVDSIFQDSVIFFVFLEIGKRYELSYLMNGNVPVEVLSKIRFRQSDYEGKPFSFDLIQKEQQKILKYYEDSGYPFAEVRLDSFEIVGNQIFSKVYVEPNELILIDSVVVHGNTGTKSKFIQNFLQIFPGDVYSQQKVSAIARKIRQLPYMTLSKDVEVVFTPGLASINIYLQKQRANQFNFVIGVLPNNQLSDRKLTITGDGRLHLQNSFGVGEEIFAEFKQIRPLTQNLEMDFRYPYLLNLPLGVEGAFDLYKNDTLFVNIDAGIGTFYQFSGANHFKAFYHSQTSNVLNYDTAAIRLSEQLPTTIDVRNNRYGIGVFLQDMDYVLNPRDGYRVSIHASVGNKVIKKSNSIAALKGQDGSSLDRLYDDFDLKSLTYGLNIDFDYFFPLKKRSTVMLSNTSEAIIAKNIFFNEMYRIGGSRKLRGVDEESIFTPFYSLTTVEYRFLLSKNSFFNVFFDFAVVEDSRKGAGSIDMPLGFGTGLALETKGGIFSLSYALGRQFDNNIEVRNGKIHFGYITLF